MYLPSSNTPFVKNETPFVWDKFRMLTRSVLPNLNLETACSFLFKRLENSKATTPKVSIKTDRQHDEEHIRILEIS